MLGQVLDRHGLDRVGPRFFRRTKSVVDNAWHAGHRRRPRPSWCTGSAHNLVAADQRLLRPPVAGSSPRSGGGEGVPGGQRFVGADAAPPASGIVVARDPGWAQHGVRHLVTTEAVALVIRARRAVGCRGCAGRGYGRSQLMNGDGVRVLVVGAGIAGLAAGGRWPAGVRRSRSSNAPPAPRRPRAPGFTCPAMRYGRSPAWAWTAGLPSSRYASIGNGSRTIAAACCSRST